MEALVKLNNQTAGRDKIARLLQYLSRVLWHRLQNYNKDSASSIKNLEYQLSTFRKLLRFGRCLDTLYGVLPLFQESNKVVQITSVLSKISSALFLLADHFLWLGRADVCTIKTEKWSQISNKYWLYSLTMNLVRDFYEISQILKNDKSLLQMKDKASFSCVAGKVTTCILQNKSIFVDTVKNGCDILIPLTALGHIKLSPGTIGLLGAISSIAGMMVLLDPKLKL